MAARDEASLRALFLALGLNEKKVDDTIPNESLSGRLVTLCEMAEVTADNCPEGVGLVLYVLASEKAAKESMFAVLLPHVLSGKIANSKQISAACKFLKSNGTEGYDEDAFKTACGIDVNYTEEELNAEIEKSLEKYADDIKDAGTCWNTGRMKGEIARAKPWCDVGYVDERITARIAEIAAANGFDEAEYRARPKKKGKAKGKGKEKAAAPAEVIVFPDPKDNKQVNDELLAAHLERTGGAVVTRFPPEPNGYLHLGHAKAMNLNFGYAKEKKGRCYLRFDDTNPYAEKEEFFEEVENCVRWLGHEPFAVTAASDHFDTMYNLAIKLITDGNAYVCHLSGDQISEYRMARRPSPYRNRTVEENLKLFDDMKKGKVAEGVCCLRMKMDYTSDNPCMHDLVAYRVLHAPHDRSGDKWCIYPSYDFEHCIVDSLEDITHSLCTLEFVLRRESYNWLNDALGLYKSIVWEYSRLNITHVVLSKRKLTALVTEGHVRGWDDPRMPTINGYRRRGYTASAINSFCESCGVTRNENLIAIERLEHAIRSELNETAPRTMIVLDPVRVVITNWPEGKVEEVECPLFPVDPSRGSYTNPHSGVVYLDRSDFRVEDSPNYYGLAPGKEVRLKYTFNVVCTGFSTDDSGAVSEITVEADFDSANTDTKTLTWVGERAAVPCEARIYGNLFTSENVAALDDWRADLNPDSLIVHANAVTVPSLAGAAVESKYQAERVGYFSVDYDSSPNHLVLNRTCTLKEGTAKKAR